MVFAICLCAFLSASEEVFYAVHVKRQREAQRLVERIALCCGDDISRVKREDIHLKAGSHGEVFAVTLVC